MKNLTSWILSTGEKLGIRTISRFFWPPAAAHTVVIRDGKLLVVDTEDYLMLPGGLLDRGENFEDAAIRETWEETGLEIELSRRFFEEKREYMGVAVYFTAEICGGQLKESWEGTPKWIPVENLESYQWRFDRDIRKLLDKTD